MMNVVILVGRMVRDPDLRYTPQGTAVYRFTLAVDRRRSKNGGGQLVVVTPDSACLRCGPLLSDAVLAAEQIERPRGYDRKPNAPGAPQVVSMNGALASEATNAVLDLITGYAAGARGSGWWSYDGRRGELTPCASVSRRDGCPACAEQAHGDGI